VVWTISRRFDQLPAAVQQAQESRRFFIKGAGALAAAGTLLTIGVLDKLARFFRGPEMTLEEESELLQKKLDRLNMAAKERELEIERMKSPYIKVAQLAELGERDGKYFTDYQMRPALAFKDEQGLPILISAKCTHLGCTVASTLDNENRLLCPCHISYFDVKSGVPNPGSPAKAPLPRLGWALMDPLGNVVMSQAPDGTTEGAADPAQLDTYSVYISKRFEENA
jgi:nitrite reductase/ring-hydroxylating ferredoxin subunit